MQEDERRLQALAALIGLAVLFFAVIRWLPDAVTSSGGRPSPNITAGYLVAGIVYCGCLYIALPRRLLNKEFSSGLFTAGLYLYVMWVLIQTFWRPEAEELARSLGTALLVLSADALGRYLGERGRYKVLLVKLTPYFLLANLSGIVIGLMNPASVWWGYGVLESNFARSDFFWLRVPEPLFAVFALISSWGRSAIGTWGRAAYPAAILLITATAVLTRTRLLIIPIALAVGLYAVRRSRFGLLVAAFLFIVLLSTTNLVTEIGEFTRLSAFLTGEDPLSGGSDPTNGRWILWEELVSLWQTQPLTGVGSAEVQARIAHLPLTSEAGLLFPLASYGLGSALLAFYVFGGGIRAGLEVLRGEEDSLLYCMAVVVAGLGLFHYFGTASSFNDWLGLVVLSTALHTSGNRRDRVEAAGAVGSTGRRRAVGESKDVE